ncbi:MAG TPA: glycosyltransferase family 1 protein [Gemmataceae bacterium]|nr:glycosyltransferase family 1 protein [Gemmataceae bacterium]
MRVLVNGLAAAGPMTGIGHYTTQLLRCLRTQADGDEIHAFPSWWLRQARSLWVHLRSQLDRGGQPNGSTAKKATAQKRGWHGLALRALRSSGQWLLSRSFQSACRGGFDLYHEPNYIPLPSDLPTVATVHDLSVLLHPEWHPADRVAHFENRFRRGLKQCRHFLAISESARQEIIRTLHLRPDQVTRTYMGIRPGLMPLPEQKVQQSLRQLNLPARYLLYVGTIEPRKNLAMLLRAYRALEARIRRDYPLVLVGNWGWNSGEVARLLESKDCAAEVIHLGYVPEGSLSALYNGARALVYPSLYEGFGLPPVEMLACGGAVLASTAGALTETVGRQAHLIEPLDLDGWRRAMQRVVEDDDWRQALRRGAVEAAKPFTWEQCAADTLRVYRQLCGKISQTSIQRHERHKIAG